MARTFDRSEPFPDRLVDLAPLYCAERAPDRPALADPTERLSYGKFAAAVRRTAGLYRESGIRAGDRIIVAMANSVAQLVAHYGALHAGAVSVPLAPGSPAARLSFCLADTEARLLVAGPEAEAAAREALASAGDARLVTAKPADNAETSLADAAGLAESSPGQRHPDDLASLMYTSGSTDFPKAVMLPHRSLCKALDNIIGYVGYRGAEREAVVLPLSHSFGLGHVYCNLACGGFVWVDDGLKRAKRLFAALSDEAINGMPATPTLLKMLLGRYRDAFLPSATKLSFMVVDSEPMPPATSAELLAALPRLRLLVYYGLTEASRSTFIDLSTEPSERHTSVGPATPNVTIGIDTGRGTPKTEAGEGEVWITGDHLASGYWRRPEESAAAFRDGWLRTGDLGKLDADGYLTLTGRLKDQINVGGLKVGPGEVESVLRAHPAVADAACAEAADPLGMRELAVGALVVMREGEAADTEALQAFCTSRLDVHMVPAVIQPVAAIPRSDSGKILRREVREALARAAASGAD